MILKTYNIWYSAIYFDHASDRAYDQLTITDPIHIGYIERRTGDQVFRNCRMGDDRNMEIARFELERYRSSGIPAPQANHPNQGFPRGTP